MCGRYYIPEPDDDSGFRAIIELVQNNCKDSPSLGEMKLGEIYPTNIVPAITDGALVLMKWGFSRFDGTGHVINARLETASEKPMFRKAYDTQRCLLPAGYYYEWLKDGASKHKYAIGTGAPIYMAGLYRYEENEQLPVFVILTRPAAAGISFIHDRMPVIVPDTIRQKWLMMPIDTRELLNASEENLKYKEAV